MQGLERNTLIWLANRPGLGAGIPRLARALSISTCMCFFALLCCECCLIATAYEYVDG